MPILVVCPGCGASLNAPDSGAGKRVRCPKPNCGTLIPVPAPVDAEPVEAEEVPEPRSRSSRAPVDDDGDRPRSKRRRDDEDDDRPQRKRRGDEEDDRPRGRRRVTDEDRPARRRQKGGGGAGKIVAIVLGSLLLLAGLGYGVYALVSKSGPKTPPPPGWNEYTYKEANFKAFFPKQPTVLGQNIGNLPAMGGLGGGGLGDFGDGLGIDSNFICMSGDAGSDPVHIQVHVMLFKSRVPSVVRDQYARMGEGFDQFGGKQLGIEAKSVRWLGERGTEIVMPNNVTRVVAVDRGVYQVTISGRNGRPTPEQEKAFFDNFVLLK